jgi:hypothetical protein
MNDVPSRRALVVAMSLTAWATWPGLVQVEWEEKSWNGLVSTSLDLIFDRKSN